MTTPWHSLIQNARPRLRRRGTLMLHRSPAWAALGTMRPGRGASTSGNVKRFGVCGGVDMTGRAVFGWGIVDGLGVAAGRNARGRRDAQCRADEARPARQPPRHRRLGADAARGQAAPGVRPASRRRHRPRYNITLTTTIDVI